MPELSSSEALSAFTETLKAAFQRIKTDQGMTLDDVARKAAVSRTTVDAISSGKRVVNFYTAMRVLYAIDASMSDIAEIMDAAGRGI